jgi:ketosteroid isomerase-like protein
MAPIELIQRYLTAMRSGDRQTGYGYFAEDVVVRIPGHSSFAGTHQGRQVAIDYIESAIAKAHAGEVEVELVDALASQDRVCLMVRERFTFESGTVEIRRANVYRVRGDEISEISIFEGDQYEVDALFGVT